MPTPESYFEIETPNGPISLWVPDGVMTPSPYSTFMAREMPKMDGYVLADLGTGSGVQALAALRQGAKLVYLLDINPAAVETAHRNARLNGYGNRVVALDSGDMLEPLGNRRVDGIICNPASLPMPKPVQPKYSPYYAGEDGRGMINRLITDSQKYLKRGGAILFVQTSLANLNETRNELWGNGYLHQILARMHLRFRDFYNRSWIDMLAERIFDPGIDHSKLYRKSPYLEHVEVPGVGSAWINRGHYAMDDNAGLYDTDDTDTPYERLYLMGAALFPFHVDRVQTGSNSKGVILEQVPSFVPFGGGASLRLTGTIS